MDNEASDSFPQLKQPAPPLYSDDAADYFAPQDAHPFGGDGFWTPRRQHSTNDAPNGSTPNSSVPVPTSHESAAAGPEANGAALRPEANRHDTPTQPIDVPGRHEALYSHESAIIDSSPTRNPPEEDDAFVQDFLARRRPSISFDPKVRLDPANGSAQINTGPPPRPATRKNSKKRSVFEEIAKKTAGPQRALSETDRSEYDPHTGRRLDDPDAPEADGRPRDGRYVTNQPRWPLLQATVDELAAGNPQSRQRSAGASPRPAVSLSTSFAPLADPLLSPISLGSPAPHDAHASPHLSPLDASPHARPRRAGKVSPQRTFSAAPHASYTAAQRSVSRRATSASVSPSSAASHHLSKYAPAPAPATPPASPDAEGQEIRDYVLGRQIGFGGFSVIREAVTFAPVARKHVNGHATAADAVRLRNGNGDDSASHSDDVNADGMRVLRRAVKIVRRSVPGARDAAANARLQRSWEREIALWRRLRHPHILPLYEVAETPFATFAFTHLNTGGTLFDAVRAHRYAAHARHGGANGNAGGGEGGAEGGVGGGGLPARLVRRYARQLARALAYLHTQAGVVHRDLKLENCLLDMGAADARAVGGRLLLCDFGLAEYIPPSSSASSATASDDENGGDDEAAAAGGVGGDDGDGDGAGAGDPRSPALGPSRLSTSFDGSLPYAAPELLDARGDGAVRRAPAVDLWALGCVVFALATGRLPFEDAFLPRLRLLILGNEWDRTALRRREEGARFGGEGEEVDGGRVGMRRGDDASGSDRGSLLAGVAELVEGCLTKESRKRWDVRQCLEGRWLEREYGEEFRTVVGEEGGVVEGRDLNGWAASGDD